METRRLDHGTLAYWRGGQGAPVLLVHGFPLDHRMWALQLEGLAKTADVIAVDLPGCGRSELGKATWTIADLAGVCDELLKELEITQPLTLIGLSLGGYVAFEFCRQFPQRLSQLVLCHTRPEADDEATRRGRLQMAEQVPRVGTAEAITGMRDKLFAPSFLRTQAERVESLMEIARQTPPNTIAALQRAMSQRVDAREWLREIRCPALVIGGAEDRITPVAGMRSWAAELPRGQFAEVPQAGHLSPYENSATFNRLVEEFLRAEGSS